jgi:hypothetical protein
LAANTLHRVFALLRRQIVSATILVLMIGQIRIILSSFSWSCG